MQSASLYSQLLTILRAPNGSVPDTCANCNAHMHTLAGSMSSRPASWHVRKGCARCFTTEAHESLVRVFVEPECTFWTYYMPRRSPVWYALSGPSLADACAVERLLLPACGEGQVKVSLLAGGAAHCLLLNVSCNLCYEASQSEFLGRWCGTLFAVERVMSLCYEKCIHDCASGRSRHCLCVVRRLLVTCVCVCCCICIDAVQLTPSTGDCDRRAFRRASWRLLRTVL